MLIFYCANRKFGGVVGENTHQMLAAKASDAGPTSGVL